MNTKNLLDQLFRTGSEMIQNNSSSMQNSGNLKNGLSSLISDKGTAALAGGALGLLIGNKSGRKMGGKVLTYGGLAVLGTLAYKAYQNYQQQSSIKKNDDTTEPLKALGNPDSEVHSRAILIALIAASKADGHIDEREMQVIDKEVARFANDPTLQKWFESELKKPIDPAEVARYATTQVLASEMYLASLLAIDQQNFMEKSYLDELARQLNIPKELQLQISEQAKKAIEQY